MSSHQLTPAAKLENAAALASALGLSMSDAASALEVRLVVTFDPMDPVARHLSEETIALLARTVTHVSNSAQSEIDGEIVIGAAAPRTSSVVLYVDVTENFAAIGRSRIRATACHDSPRFLLLMTACYAAAGILYHTLSRAFPFTVPNPLVLDFASIGIDRTLLGRRVDLKCTYMAGAGAIGNGFLWAARHLNFHGELNIVDDDTVSSGNLNRQIWFTADDINDPKVERLVAHAQASFPSLTLLPRRCRLQELPERSGAWLQRLIVAVDSRRARRSLQNEFPGEVFDASTTDIREIVLHRNKQPGELACMSCIYEPDRDEQSREQHIAEHLGVSVSEVQSERVSAQTARLIAARYPELDPGALEGAAYDTLFKQLCSEGKLEPVPGKTIVAPFAFVSVLAGAFLALEVVRRAGNSGVDGEYNYWRVSPWSPPLARRRTLRERQPGCEFCGNPILQSVNRSLWLKAEAGV